MGLRVNRAQQLEQLAGAVPGRAEAQAATQQAGQQMQLQQAFGAAARQPGLAPTASQIQQMGAEVTKARGQAAIQAQQAGLQQLSTIGEEQLRVEQEARQNALFAREERISTKERELQQRLYAADRKLGRQLFSDQMRFAQDELGRKLFNERQLTDWAVLKAKDAQDLANYEQLVSNMSERKMKLYEVAQRRIIQELNFQHELDETRRDGELMVRLTKAKRAMELKMQKEAARAKARAGMFGALGTLGGMGIAAAAVATFATGGLASPLLLPALAAGGAMGQGFGTAAGTME